MKTKSWSQTEIQQLKTLRAEGKSSREIARALSRTVKAVEQACARNDIPATAPEVTGTLQEDLEARDNSFWQRQFEALNKKYEKALLSANAVERLVGAVRDMAPKSYDRAPAIIKDKALRNHGTAQSAVLMLSDQHVGAVVDPGQTLDFGGYNFPIFLARLKYLESSIISIVRNHITTPVPELVIAMLGDFLDGALQHSAEVGQVNPMFNQFFMGAHATVQFLRNLSPYFPAMRIYSTVGNHPRMQNQKKMPTKNRHSNFDQFAYALIRELLRDVPSIKWDLDAQPYQIFEVNGFVFYAGHGDNLRGGDKNLGIPNHAIGRVVSTTTQLLNKYNRKSPNYYLYGHLHRNISLPHATGDVLINGGFVGVDGFGLSESFTPADPMQRLFFVHPRYGKTASYDIGLKWAEVTEQPPYVLPHNFPMQ